MANVNLDANTLEVIGAWERRGLAMKPVPGAHYAVGPSVQRFADAFSSGQSEETIKAINGLGFEIGWQSAFRYFGNPVSDTENQLGVARGILKEAAKMAVQLGITGKLHAFAASQLGLEAPLAPGRSERAVWLQPGVI